MRFGAFYFMSGAMFAAGALKTSAQEPWFGWLLAGALASAIIGAMFEACNPAPR